MKNYLKKDVEKEKSKQTFETINLPLTDRSCSLCEEYAQINSEKKYAVISCEGACLRGEIARQVANIICFDKEPDKTVVICMGGAFTKNTGQRALVRNADKVLAIEGCSIDCASRTMQSVLPSISSLVVETDKIAEFDKALFAANELPHEEVMKIAEKVATKIVTDIVA